MRIPIWMVALCVAGIGASGVGCSGGGDDDDDDDDDDDGTTLQSGTYDITAGSTDSDGCAPFGVGDLSELVGEQLDVAVSAGEVTINDGDPHALTGSTFTQEAVVEYAWNDLAFAQNNGGTPLSQAYNCYEVDTFTNTGTILSPSSFSYEIAVAVTVSSGDAALCIAANDSAYGATFASLPCTSSGSIEAER